uniref:Leishmanolysin-like peptidase n=1 Tax=Trichuris muris TaxID=70415 RepID=A0A5S6QE25_TRIMR
MGSQTYPQESDWSSIRIKVFYSIGYYQVLSNETRDILSRAMQLTLDFLASAISVQRLKVPLRLNRSEPCLHGKRLLDLNESTFIHGVKNADLAIIMDASDAGTCVGDTATVAHAAPCELHPISGRPIKGRVAICKGKVEQLGLKVKGSAVTLLHEMMHVLVFSPDSLFHRFNTPDVRKAAKNVTVLVKWAWKVGNNDSTIVDTKLVNSPHVLKAVRDYTGCADLEGAQLENGGTVGTVHSHWEKRIFGPELMTGVQSPIAPFSVITAALLQDSGWYLVNNSVIEDLEWGKGLGCKFARQSCREYMDQRPNVPDGAHPYCNFKDYVLEQSIRLSMLRCSARRDHVRSCVFKTSDNITKKHQVFRGKSERLKDGRNIVGDQVIGDDELADYCPMWKVHQRGVDKKKETDSVCADVNNQPKRLDNFAMEIYGPSSKCFEQETVFVKLRCVGARILGRVDYAYEKASGAACYEYKCEMGRLFVRAKGFQRTSTANAFKVCWAKGSAIALYRYQKDFNGSTNLYRGSILCPSCEEICEGANDDFKCGPEVPGIFSRDPLISPCWSRAFMPRIANNLILTSTLLIVILSRCV